MLKSIYLSFSINEKITCAQGCLTLRWKSSTFKIKKGKSLHGAREETRVKNEHRKKEQSSNQTNYKIVHFTYVKPTGLNWTFWTHWIIQYALDFGFDNNELRHENADFLTSISKRGWNNLFSFLNRIENCGVRCESKRMILSWPKCYSILDKHQRTIPEKKN